jgi:general L-amino acid transport system substrate-binding protein
MKKLTKPLLIAAAAAASLLATAPAFAGKTVDAIKARGQVVCGVNTGLAGFAAADSSGKWSGIDVDTCKALAAATLGDAEKVKYVPLNAQQRFTALQSGEIDVLARNTTFTLTRDASLGLSSTVVTYYDGQGFMVPVKTKMKSAKQLKGQTVCVQSGTTTEKNLTDYSKANNLNIKPVVFEKLEAAENAYFTGRCIAYTTDASGLSSTRSKVAKDPKEHMILPELISKEPLGPMVRRGDDEWFAIVKWVIYGTMEAEEYGITQANVDQMKAQHRPGRAAPAGCRQRRHRQAAGPGQGLDDRVIKAVGNYGESFERNVGPKTPLNLPPWPQQPVEQGRPDVRLPGALILTVRIEQLLPEPPWGRQQLFLALRALPTLGERHS